MNLTIDTGFGIFVINSDDFTKIEGNGAVYYDIAAESIKEAYAIRNNKFPKHVVEDNLYYQVRTTKDDIIGRDRLGDYDDIISEPTILDEIRNSNIDGVKKWIDYGLNINSLMGQTPNSFTPLILACQKGDIEIVKLLLESGADANLVGDPAYKTSPLSENCREGNAEICNLLLSKGANKNHVDAGGWAPLKFAEEFHNTEIISLLTGIDEKDHEREETSENRPEIKEMLDQLIKEQFDTEPSQSAKKMLEEEIEKRFDAKYSQDFEHMHHIIFYEEDDKVSFLIRYSFMFTLANMLEGNPGKGQEPEKLIDTLRKKMGNNDPWEEPSNEDLKKSIESIKYLKATYPDFARTFYKVYDMWVERINGLYKCEEKTSIFNKLKTLLRF